MAARPQKKDINLLVNREPEKSFNEQLLSWAITYGRYIIIITQITVLSVFFGRFKLDRDFTDLQDLLKQKQAIVESFADLEKEIRHVQDKLSHIGAIEKGQPLSAQLLAAFSTNSPSDARFSSLSYDGDTVHFAATVATLRSFNAFLYQVQKDGWLTDLVLEDISRRSDGRIEFRMHATVHSQELPALPAQ